MTYAITTAGSAATTATATSASTSRLSATATLATGGSLTSIYGTLSLLTGWLRLAGKLDGDLALKDLLARELSNGTLGLAGGRQVDESVANWAVGAWVLWDGGGFTIREVVSNRYPNINHQ